MTDTKQSDEAKFWKEVLRTVLAFGGPDDGTDKINRARYWLFSLHYLLGTEIEDVQNDLPEKHPLKSTEPNSEGHDQLLKPKILAISQNFKLPKTKKIDFSGLHFENAMDFSNFIFPEDTDFSNTTFSKDVLFTDAVFFEAVDFKNAQFNGERAKFKNTTFKKIADFSDTIFQHYANFKGSVFNGRTTFQRANFVLHALRFYGVDLNNEIIWTGIKRPTLFKTKNDKIDEHGKRLGYMKSRAKYRKRVGENQNAYETLAYLMDKQEKYHDQHFFFRQEMRCRRNLEWFFIKPFYWLYQIFADYGYGIGWAFSWWAVNITGGSVILMFLINDCWGYRDLEYWKNLSCSISISLSNSTPFAFISFEESSLTKCYEKLENIDPVLISTIKVTQTVFGILFLFLLLTTLRVRFRLK